MNEISQMILRHCVLTRPLVTHSRSGLRGVQAACTPRHAPIARSLPHIQPGSLRVGVPTIEALERDDTLLSTHILAKCPTVVVFANDAYKLARGDREFIW